MLPVSYTETSLQFVSEYSSKEDKKGTDWDVADNPDLTRVKTEIKEHYKVAQNYTCPYCMQRIVVDHSGTWDAEHIIPKSTHPQFMFEALNLCVSCKDCNDAKSNKNVLKNKGRKTFPKKSNDYIICHPHFDDYFEHISIVEVGFLYVPYTKKGAKTAEICDLHRFPVMHPYKLHDVKELCGIFESAISRLSSSKSPQESYSIACVVLYEMSEVIKKTKALSSAQAPAT